MLSHALSTSILAGSLFTGLSQAYWRLSCSLSQTSRIDPIINPGSLSGHVHKFAGASNINAQSTYDSLLQAPCSTCEIQDDKSAYWTPSLYYQHSNGSFEEVPNNGMAVYYLGRGDNQTLVPFPPGFRMVSGDKGARSYKKDILIPGGDRPLSDRVNFACLDGTYSKEQPWMAKTDCKDGLRAQVHFQSCWNGRDLYKPDNSHVEYLSRVDNGGCPSSHPVPLIHLFYEVLYAVNDIKLDGGKFVFSQGDPTGYGFHGDFMNGWKTDVLAAGIKQCAFTGQGGVQYCPPFQPSLDSEFSKHCPHQPPLDKEPVHGMLNKLPGCITVRPGPEDAKESDMSCPDGHKPRSLDEESLSQPDSESLDKADEQTVPEGDYGYGYDFDLPSTTTRGPPPSYGSPKPRSKRSKSLDETVPEEYPSYGYGYDWPTTTTRGPTVINGSPRPHYARGKRGYKPADDVLEA
ncbi:MAG: hypothetical protein L6R36_005974 [Xanthoria steineri]|nr:MAG: hypothetical protein L6R36_005974 [Xanthoria steineri]